MTSDLNMVPFIDLLFVTIAFLLITAVWATSARLDAGANVPGKAEDSVHVAPPDKILHVHLEDKAVRLVWKLGQTVVSEETVPQSGQSEDGRASWGSGADSLEARIRRAWGEHGGHRDASDEKQDRAVVHVDDKAPHRELVRMLDAVAKTRRPLRLASGSVVEVPAMAASLAR